MYGLIVISILPQKFWQRVSDSIQGHGWAWGRLSLSLLQEITPIPECSVDWPASKLGSASHWRPFIGEADYVT